MKFNSSARFNRKSFNSEKLFDQGVHSATVTNLISLITGGSVVNGDFETGDLTGWTEDGGQDGGGTFDVSVTNADKHSGTYSAKFEAASTALPDDTAWCYLTQTVDLTDIDTLSFWFKFPTRSPPSGFESRFSVWIGAIPADMVYERNTTLSDWTKIEIDVSTYSGNKLIWFILSEF